jgi:Leucine-rich repeat (LRR) protein
MLCLHVPFFPVPAQNLETLVNLRRASFVDNQISHIEGLSACTALEELCLEDNRIATIEGLQGLTRSGKHVAVPLEVVRTLIP